MKSFPNLSRRFFTKFSVRRALTLSLTSLLLVTSPGLTWPGASVSAQAKASAQLRAAVAANSDAELQRVESTFPNTPEAGLAHLLRGYLRLQAKDFATAATLLSDPVIAQHTLLGDYAHYYRGQALQETGRGEEAEREFRRLAQRYPTSLLARSAALQAAGSAMLRENYQAALADLTALVEKNDGTALKLRADALDKLGKPNEAILALRKLYFDAPQTPEAEKVAVRLTELGGSTAPQDIAQGQRRADKLYEAGLYVLAAQAYDQVARQFPTAASDDLWLRAGISYYRANQFKPAVDALTRVRARTPKTMSDALYHLGMAQLSLQNEPGSLQALADLRRSAPGSDRIGNLLYGLGRFHEKRGRNDQAAEFYQQLVRQFPQTESADEAHFWLAWRAHEAKDFDNASRLLTEHVANYSNVTDNRGRAAFWAAVDAERAGDKGRAMTICQAMLTRYGAGWYGVNCERRIARLKNEGIQPRAASGELLLGRAVAGLQTVNVVKESLAEADWERVNKAQELMRIALHQSAMNELDTARVKAPNSPIVNLRIAQIFRANNENVAAINALKRAYPDYGQMLPEEMTREAWDVFYPLKYWTNIKEEAKRQNLDPYFVAGLIRQETVFNPLARSRANALGLMQFIPSTGKAVARKNNLGNISSNDLFNPTLSIQLGTAYLRELLDEFKRWEYVAAAYNGGETRVRRWVREWPGGDIEDWVESIPLSETRGYVQGVYRNARQYQRLYDEQGRFRSIVPEN